MENIYEVYEIALFIIEENETNPIVKLTIDKVSGEFKFNESLNRFMEVTQGFDIFDPVTIPNYVTIVNDHGLIAYRGHAGYPTAKELESIREELKSYLLDYLSSKLDTAVTRYNRLMSAL